MSYREVLAVVLRRVAEAQDLVLADPDALAPSRPEWPPVAEVPDDLRELRKRGWRLAILSNTDPDLLDASIKRLDVDVDVRITVAEAGSYKPAHGHWEQFFASTDADPAGHAHVAASLFHDIAPACRLGLRSVWINRKDETTDLEPSAELPTLAGLADALDALVVA
jgi:2-haloacid dehalogenase